MFEEKILERLLSLERLRVVDVTVGKKLAIASGMEVDFDNVTIQAGGYIYIAGVFRVHGKMTVEDGGKVILEDGGVLSYVG